MGNIYTRINPATMILDMGEANKVLRITSDAIYNLFGFCWGYTPRYDPAGVITRLGLGKPANGKLVDS